MKRRRKRPSAVPFVITALTLGALSAPVHAVILGLCTVSAGGVNFGTYDPLSSTALASTATVSVNCTLVTSASPITVNLSTGVSGTYTARTLQSGASSLSYNLYKDTAHTQIWGDGTGGSLEDSDNVTPGRPTLTATVYGLIPASQDVSPGAYNDTITVTVNY